MIMLCTEENKQCTLHKLLQIVKYIIHKNNNYLHFTKITLLPVCNIIMIYMIYMNHVSKKIF